MSEHLSQDWCSLITVYRRIHGVKVVEKTILTVVSVLIVWNVAIMVGTMLLQIWNAQRGWRRIRCLRSGSNRTYQMQQLSRGLRERMVLKGPWWWISFHCKELPYQQDPDILQGKAADFVVFMAMVINSTAKVEKKSRNCWCSFWDWRTSRWRSYIKGCHKPYQHLMPQAQRLSGEIWNFERWKKWELVCQPK